MSEENIKHLTEFDYYVVKGSCADVLYMSNNYENALEEMKNNPYAESLVKISERTLFKATAFKAMKGE